MTRYDTRIDHRLYTPAMILIIRTLLSSLPLIALPALAATRRTESTAKTKA